MENTYWLNRQRASLKLAQNAAGAEARLVHYELAGRYGLKALSAGILAIDLVAETPPSIHAGKANGTTKNSYDA